VQGETVTLTGRSAFVLEFVSQLTETMVEEPVAERSARVTDNPPAVDGSPEESPAQTVEPEAGMTIGFDAQINDAKDGSRSGITKWNDATDNSWQDTSNWGELVLE
jgi:hypothetical protein